jgi:hypothetical protein
MADESAYLQSAIEVNPSLYKVIDHSAKPFVAYSKEESPSEDEKLFFSAVSSTSVDAQLSLPLSVPTLKCQLCLRACWKLAKLDFVRKLVENQLKHLKSKGAAGDEKKEIDAVSLAVDESCVVCAIDADPGLRLDIEHDDHAQVNIMSDAALPSSRPFTHAMTAFPEWSLVQTWQSRGAVC